jgi:RNA polymerase sigma-70 factor, ECF subfamily
MNTDKEILRSTDEASKDRAARLLARYRPALCGYLFACVRNHADVEDLFQEVSVVVLESIAQLRCETEFLCWAREIVRRRVLAHFRHQAREQVIDPELVQRLADAAECLEERAPATERESALLACLESLPERSRRLIALRYNGSAGSAEKLSRLFQLSVQAVYALIKRIKSALRVCVERRLGKELES